VYGTPSFSHTEECGIEEKKRSRESEVVSRQGWQIASSQKSNQGRSRKRGPTLSLATLSMFLTV
jgi:hypothetical protein